MTSTLNKISDVNKLAKKADYGSKVLDIEPKYFSKADYNKSTKHIVANNIKSEGLIDKYTIAGFINNASLDKKSKQH